MKIGGNREIDQGPTAGLVILPSWMGTLKSTRIRTRLPLSSTSVIEIFLESDIGYDVRSEWKQVVRCHIYDMAVFLFG